MLRQASLIILLAGLGVAFSGVPSRAASDSSTDANRTAAGTTQFLLFDVAPGSAYDVRRNGSSVASASASPSGSVGYTGTSATGDLFEFRLTGIIPVSPSTPSGLAASGNSQGCVALSWDAPAPEEYITSYALLWGTTTGVYTDSLQISRLDIADSGPSWSTSRCGFPNGTFHFAIRAHNAYDLLSGLSNVSTTTISNQNTQGPPPPTSVAATENPLGCAKVTWTQSGDPTVSGYRAYFGTKPRSQGAYTDSVDVGLVGTASRCGLGNGKFYIAVRSKTSLGILSGYSKEVSLTLQGPDVTPPTVSQMTPPDGTTNVARNTGIFFVVTDAGTGVNFSTVTVRVDGQVCLSSASVTAGGFAVQCKPASDLPANSTIVVQVGASDNASPVNTTAMSWSFVTGANSTNDVDPPVLQAVSPTDGAVGVSPGSAIEVQVSDAGLGIDFQSLVMTVDGAEVAYRVDGDQSSARVIYQPAAPFRGGSTVSVRVEACDRAATANCAAPLSFSFAVGSALVTTAEGSIVPDGFWAGDPSRPMEVRNLPRSWHVHIFDAAGTPVRRFENFASDGYNWTWDFMNDWGQRVAPALYLVRVTDDGGTVHETGRFLVQSAR